MNWLLEGIQRVEKQIALILQLLLLNYDRKGLEGGGMKVVKKS